MPVSRLTVLGAGSTRCAPGIVGSLASYFGELPLEIRFYDADEERLDTFDRLARLCFESYGVSHLLISTTDPIEALADTEAVILAIDANCAHRMLAKSAEPQESDIQTAVNRLIGDLPTDVAMLSLLDESISLPRTAYYRSPWPGPLADESRYRLPMQILRWLNKEDMLYDLLSSNEHSPLKAWLDDPRTADMVLGSLK